MKKLINSIKGFFLLLMAMGFTTIANAASVWDSDTVISPPVGRSVLPGGGLQANEIKESFIFTKFLPFLIDYAIRAAVALSVIVLILGGYQYMTSYGDQEKQQTARKTLTYALIGLILAITAYGIVTIITSIQLTAPPPE